MEWPPASTVVPDRVVRELDRCKLCEPALVGVRWTTLALALLYPVWVLALDLNEKELPDTPPASQTDGQSVQQVSMWGLCGLHGLS